MTLSLIIGAGIISFILIFLATKLNEEEHFTIRLFFICFAIIFLIIIGKGTIDANQNCELLLNNTYATTTDGNVTNTSYKYSTICYSANESTTPITAYKLTSWLFIIFMSYILYYLGYWLFTKINVFYKKRK